MLELMTLVETGTRAVIGAVFGPTELGETGYACKLLHLLRPDMLVLWDRPRPLQRHRLVTRNPCMKAKTLTTRPCTVPPVNGDSIHAHQLSNLGFTLSPPDGIEQQNHQRLN
ncbi:hypothetical protein [Nocardia sp. CY41]|uniref:hypothetical protein n=1 Tax=Nocardia sp. CY41 TaxID=2608686 RepID=UPI00135CA300